MTNLNLQTPISSYAERLKHTPKVHSDRGYWTGNPYDYTFLFSASWRNF